MKDEDFPFIAFLEKAAGNNLTAKQLPEGGIIQLHESATKETSLLVVEKIRMKAIDLRCLCGNPRCSLRLRLRVERSGNHPLLENQG